MELQKRNAEMVDLLKTDFVGRNEPNFAWGNAVSAFLMLPGLRGCWPMSSFNEAGNCYDVSGQGRTLTYNGNPKYSRTGLAPILILDGTGDWLNRADEAGLDITGLETQVNNPGLTLGGWFNFNRLVTAESCTGKWSVAAQTSYEIYKTNANVLQFGVTNDGSTVVAVNSTVAATTGAWKFIVGRFIPSTELAIWVNDVKTINVVGIPASLFSGTSAFEIGHIVGGSPLQASISLQFLCGSALPDVIISSLYQQTKALFNV